MKVVMTKTVKAVEKVLRAHPGLDREGIADESGVLDWTVVNIVNRLRALPVGHPMRIRVKSYSRVHDFGKLRECFEFHPDLPDAKKPKKKTTADYCKTYREKRKALINVTKNGARSKFAQGGVYGMWAGLRA